MKPGIHPTYYEDAVVICACGNTWTTGSTKKEIHTDVCSKCHPFYTGEQRIVDAAGQVERFMKRAAAKEQLAPKPAAEPKPAKRGPRPRARGDMRSGARGERRGEPAEAEPAAEPGQAPEAIMIEETPEGRRWEAVPVEPVEGTPPVEPGAPVSESVVESEARAARAVPGETAGLTEVSISNAEAGVAAETAGPQEAQAAAEGARPRRPRRSPRAPRKKTEVSEANAAPEGESEPEEPTGD